MPPTNQSETWLTLAQAAETLNVHPTTLRRWANSGQIPVMLTPGGHRRFAQSDVIAFAEQRRGLTPNSSVEQAWAQEAMSQTRAVIAANQDQRWLSSQNSEGRAQMRSMGRRLMGLMMQFISGDEPDETMLDEAKQIGYAYAADAQRQQLGLQDALEATLFFRDNLIEAAINMPQSTRVQADRNVNMMRRINRFLNTVQLAIAEAYDTSAPNTLSGN